MEARQGQAGVLAPAESISAAATCSRRSLQNACSAGQISKMQQQVSIMLSGCPSWCCAALCMGPLQLEFVGWKSTSHGYGIERCNGRCCAAKQLFEACE